MYISVKDYNLGDSKIFIDPRRAEPIFEKIRDALKRDEEVTLSFSNLRIVIAAVLNVAIGKLYDPKLGLADKIGSLLKITDASENILDNIKIVKANAVKYYGDKELTIRREELLSKQGIER